MLARLGGDTVDEPGRLVRLAVDGKTVRGSRADGRAVHPLAAALHDSQTVIAQRQVAAKSNEISAFVPLLEHPADHGRREIRRLKVCTVAPGLRFPYAVQAPEIKRRRVHRATRRRPCTPSPASHLSRQASLVELVQEHWSVETLHHVRDVTDGEDASRIRTSPDGHVAQPGHRPDAPGRLVQHRRRSRPLLVTPPYSSRSFPENASALKSRRVLTRQGGFGWLRFSASSVSLPSNHKHVFGWFCSASWIPSRVSWRETRRLCSGGRMRYGNHR
ncbi:hypothetical protein [Streptomyces goshikiensis]|uniref:hypothetical protein n=1 Tax=Streptomyces goshikiensis TaxID=1942 RepID=UPI00364B0EF4